MGFFGAIARHFVTFAGPVVMLLYPLYASIRAIESPSELDDQQWLTYWVLYSLITLFELSFYKVLAWLPIWPYVKLVLSFWLVLPMFNGAAYIYENYVRKLVNKYQPSSNLTLEQKHVVGKMNPTARAGVERYIAKNGRESFERIPWMFVHSEEIPAALKPYRNFQKQQKLEENDFTGAVFEGKFYAPQEFKALETMPTRAEIYAKILGSLQSPAIGLISTLQAPARDLVFTLKAYVQKLEDESGNASNS